MMSTEFLERWLVLLETMTKLTYDDGMIEASKDFALKADEVREELRLRLAMSN